MNTGSVLGDSDSTEALIHSSEIQPHLICSLSAELTRHRRPRGAQLHLVVCINVQTADHTCSREGVHVGFSTYDNCCKGRGGVRMLDAISPAIELGFLNSCCVFSKCPLFRAEADCAGRGVPFPLLVGGRGGGGQQVSQQASQLLLQFSGHFPSEILVCSLCGGKVVICCSQTSIPAAAAFFRKPALRAAPRPSAEFKPL